MKKRLILKLLLLFLLLVSVLLYFQASYQSKPEAVKNVTSPTEVELIMWTTQHGLDPLEQKYVDEFNRIHPYAKIRVVSRPEEVNTDTIASLMSKTAPDILILSDSEVLTYAYSGLLLPVEEYLREWEDLPGIDQNLLSRYTFQDHTYALPCGEYSMGLFYNKKMFAEAGVTPPDSWTWEEFQQTAVRLTDRSKGSYGFALNWNQWGNWWFQMFVWAAGGDLTTQDSSGRLITTFQDPAVIKAGEFYRSLKLSGCIQPVIGAKLDQLKKDFAEGRAAMIYNGMDDIPSFLDYGMELSDLGVLPIPAGPSGKSQTQLGGSAYVMHIGVPSEKRQAVFDYYTLVSSKAYYEESQLFYGKQNAAYIRGTIRSDVTPFSFSDQRPDLFYQLNQYEKNGRYSFYGNPVLTSFVDEAIAHFMKDDTADIKEVFSYYEKEANKQAVPQYNQIFDNRYSK